MNYSASMSHSKHSNATSWEITFEMYTVVPEQQIYRNHPHIKKNCIICSKGFLLMCFSDLFFLTRLYARQFLNRIAPINACKYSIFVLNTELEFIYFLWIYPMFE